MVILGIAYADFSDLGMRLRSGFGMTVSVTRVTQCTYITLPMVMQCNHGKVHTKLRVGGTVAVPIIF